MKPFVIIFLGRSGSTHLCSLLNSHPQVYCGLEVFCLDHNGPRPWARKISAPGAVTLAPTDEQCLEHIDKLYSQRVSAAGFKFKYPIQYEHYPVITNYLLDKDDLTVIRLNRDNILKNALSNMVFHIKRKQGFKGPHRDLYKHINGPIHMPIPLLMQSLEHSKTNRLAMNKFVADSFPLDKTVCLEYDRLLHNQKTETNKVLDALELRRVPLRSHMIKANSDNLREVIANYEQVAERLRNTEWEQYL